MNTDAFVLRDQLITLCLRRVSSERAEPSAYYEAELEYCDDMIDACAQQLTAALAKEGGDGD